MRLIAGLVAVAVSFYASPAFADWQYTKWGMTPNQVAVTSAGAVAVGPGDSGDRHPGATLDATGSYVSGEYRFKANFYFENGKLAEVRLQLLTDDPGNDNVKLRNSLQGQYGAPYENSGFIMTFHDQTKNNRVDLMTIPGSGARIVYRPLRDESASGL